MSKAKLWALVQSARERLANAKSIEHDGQRAECLEMEMALLLSVLSSECSVLGGPIE